MCNAACPKPILQFVSPFITPTQRFGHGSAKLARQAQSKEKTLAKMVGWQEPDWNLLPAWF
jgi:hypothetical protein